VKARDRKRFDALLEEVIASLPPRVRRLLDEMPVVVEDVPDKGILEDMGEEDELGLLGLHEGTPFTERSIDDNALLPSSIRLYREPIIDHAGGFDGPDASDRVREEIRVTLLHEIGHQFGLDEDDLKRLGYE
jgi:predicted Zn-dependent protease with MMP-like domain